MKLFDRSWPFACQHRVVINDFDCDSGDACWSVKALETSFDIARGEAYTSAVIAAVPDQRPEAAVRAETLHSQLHV
jgi:hypothetical protein